MSHKAVLLSTLSALLSQDLIAQSECEKAPSTQVKEIVQTVNAENPPIAMMKSAQENLNDSIFSTVEAQRNHRHILGRKLKQLEGSMRREKSTAVKTYYLTWFSRNRKQIAEPHTRTTEEVALRASIETHFEMLKDPGLSDRIKDSALQNMIDILGYKIMRSEQGIHYVGANVGVQAEVIDKLGQLIDDKTLSQDSLQNVYLALRQNLESSRWITPIESDRERTEELLLKAKALLPKIEAATTQAQPKPLSPKTIHHLQQILSTGAKY